MAVATIVRAACQITANRRGEHWSLTDEETKLLADALDPPLKRVPLPEKELGIIGELGALGFVCLGVFGPRLTADKAIANARNVAAAPRPQAVRGVPVAPPAPTHVVSEAEQITAEHAEHPYATVTPLDGFRTPMGDGTGVDLGSDDDELRVDPSFIVNADHAAREAGLTPERIVELRSGFGIEGDLLDSYPSHLLDGEGNPLPTGVEH